MNLTAADAGGTWSGTGITDGVNGTFDPGVSGAGTFTITYSIGGVCPDTDTENIVVTDLADATIDPVTDMCSQDAAINLTAQDAGGIWSGTGITNSSTGLFDPLVAGNGTFTITYSIAGTCGDTDTETITVNQQQDASINSVPPICRQVGTTTLTASNSGGTWSADCGACIDPVTGVFNTSVSGNGNFNVTYTLSGTCADSETTVVSVVDCLSLEEENNSGFSIYPNPSKDFICVMNSKNLTGTIQIQDMTGRIIYTNTIISSQLQISLSEFADGAYVVIITDENQNLVKTEKLIKQ
ncbi:MAG: T9SS type A sorting domain-containing protein [Crocinitomicaceae bacterium]|nr:T9SS type A sorting domain-containing protein [Crocinitomicaceae bacterium]